MAGFFKTISPVFLLIVGLALMSGVMVLKRINGTELTAINGLFILIGLGCYFLPVKFAEKEEGERLRRKLLWLLILAGFLILTGEIVRGLLIARNI